MDKRVNKETINQFLKQKSLSENSKQAYHYDLDQFLSLVENEKISFSDIERYKGFISELKPSAQKRKISAVNQFLYYLYQKKEVTDFYRIDGPQDFNYLTSQPILPQLQDWSHVYQAFSGSKGQLILLLILELGLQPSDMLSLRVEDIDLEFRIISLKQGKMVRILPLPEQLIPSLQEHMTGEFLFDNKGKPYTRQWVFNQLNTYLETIGRSDMTAQKLREQFIMQRVQNGVSILELAKHLGLKTTVTLEKYYQSNGY